MGRITGLRIAGLFGYVSHDVSFRLDSPTILTGPNGVGKTHVLELLRASLALDFRVLLSTNFATIEIDFLDGRSLLVERNTEGEGGPRLRITALSGKRDLGQSLRVDTETLERLTAEVPAHIRQVQGDRWVDGRTGRSYDRPALERRFRVRFDFLNRLLEGSPDIRQLCGDPTPVFIDTKRLDLARGNHATSGDIGSPLTREALGAVSRISEYTEQLRAQVVEARRNSIQATQSADLSFASRALAAAKATVNESHLHSRYDQTVERYELLARNTLAVGQAPIPFPEKTTPTVRRILSVFLDDWDKRLEPLLDLNEKLQTLREILDSKLEPSGKMTAMSPRGDLEFRTFADRRIAVSRLSSGEQHLVALFTMLLFSASHGSLVLIDEPEISLHAAWKHAFVHDITRVAEIRDLQIVMATHSSGIVNGRWDLTEELLLGVVDDSVTESEADDESDELDD